MYDYNCPDCNEAKLQSDKNARKINEVIDQVNALIQVNNETVDFIEDKANEKVGEIAEIKVNEVLGDLNTEIDNINSSLDNMTHNQNFINVKYFGAIGDGVSDDTEPIKKAIEYISLNQVALYFPTGVYNVSSNFIINKEIDYIIVGQNAEIRLLKEYQTTPIDYLFKFEQCKNLNISGIIFNGSNIGNIKTKQNYALFVDNTNNCIIENCVFKNFEGNGVYIYLNVKNFVSKNNKYIGNAIHGLNVTNVYNCTIDNDIFEDNLGQGFDIVTYRQNYQDLVNNKNYKIVSVKNSIIRNNGTGLNENEQPYSSGAKLYGCYIAKIENCVFENNGHPTHVGQQLRICNASIEENIVNGHILIDNCRFNVNNLKQKGIADFGECENLSITNCKFEGTYEYPLQIRSKGVIGNNVFDCIVDSNGNNGVKIQSSNVVFRNNIFSAKFNGISILVQIDSTIPQATNTSNVVIENNTISNAKANYAMLLQINNSIIKNNKIPVGNRIDLKQGEYNIVENTGLVKNNAQNTLFVGYCGNNSDKSYLNWSGTVKIGTQYFNTITNKLEIWNGSEWI